MRRLLFILIFFPLSTIGQTISLDIEKIGDSLRTVGIDTFIVYKNYFPGSHNFITVDRNATEDEMRKAFCEKADAVYVLYKQRGQTFIQKRNECYILKTVHFDTCEAFTFFLAHFDKIVNEKILTNSHVDKKGDTLQTFIDHSDMTDMYFSHGTTKKTITVDWFNLHPTNDIMDDAKGKKNMNYNHNIKTKTKELILLIADKTRHLTFTKE